MVTFQLQHIKKFETPPPFLPANINIKEYIKHIPLSHQVGLHHHVGAYKLLPVILDKIEKDKQKNRNVSDIEKFLSVFLYSDIQGPAFPNHLKTFIKGIKNRLTRDHSLIKIIGYYYFRTKPNSDTEIIYLNLIADLKVKVQGLPIKLKSRFIQWFKKGKKKMDSEALKS